MNQRDHLTYELISAYLDGELSRDESARVEHLLTTSDEHRQVLEDMQSLRAGLQLLPSHQLDDHFSERVVAVVRQATGHSDGAPPVSRPDPATPRTGSYWMWQRGAYAAAAVAAAVLVAFVMYGGRPDGGGVRSDSREVAKLADGHARPQAAGAPKQEPDAVPPESNQTVASAAESAGAGAATVDAPPPRNDLSVAGDENRPIVGAEGAERTGPLSPDHMAAAKPPGARRDQATAPSAAGAAGNRDDSKQPSDRQMQPVVPAMIGTQQLLLVIDVTLTREGADKRQFEQVLAGQEIGCDDTRMNVGPELEQALLESRFFDPLPPRPKDVGTANPPREKVALMFMMARGRQVDGLYASLQADRQHFSDVGLDIAMRPDDLVLFQQLRAVVERNAPHDNDSPDGRRMAAKAVAHRLALSPGWRGTPVQSLQSMHDLAAMIPGAGVDTQPPSAPPPKPPTGVPAHPFAPPKPGEALGDNLNAEVLVVLRVPPSPDP